MSISTHGHPSPPTEHRGSCWACSFSPCCLALNFSELMPNLSYLPTSMSSCPSLENVSSGGLQEIHSTKHHSLWLNIGLRIWNRHVWIIVSLVTWQWQNSWMSLWVSKCPECAAAVFLYLSLFGQESRNPEQLSVLSILNVSYSRDLVYLSFLLSSFLSRVRGMASTYLNLELHSRALVSGFSLALSRTIKLPWLAVCFHVLLVSINFKDLESKQML